MRKFPFFILALLLVACLNEKNIDPANAPTFTRYFSDGFANEPIAVEEAKDKGFIILVNSNFKNTDAEANKERIELIKTDQYGHQIWQNYFPDRDFNNGIDERWKASSLTRLGNGNYLVVGEDIETTGSNLLAFVVDDATGEYVTSVSNNPKVFDDPLLNFSSLTGRAAVVAPATSGTDSSFYVLAHSPDPAVTKNIFLGEFSRTDFAKVWTQQYEPDNVATVTVELANKLFYKAPTSIDPALLYFAGTKIYDAANINAFVTRVGLNETGTLNGLQDIVSPSTNEYALDFCQKGNSFGLVGYQTTSKLGDILFCPINSNGAGDPANVKTYITDIFNSVQLAEFNVKEEKGNGISSTKDGGYIIAGTIDTYTGELGRGNTDMFLFKINGLGDKIWSKTFGTPDADAGISARQTSDGGYVILGRSRLAALQTTVLIKTNKDGNVD